MSLGDELIIAAKAASKEVTLIAPFIKEDALAKILASIPTGTSIKVVARWIPAEIAVGVCDIEIFDLISSRPGANLYLHPLLHAKMYRFDNVVYFGSANLTRKALGWTGLVNIELLHSPVETASKLRAFEDRLLSVAHLADRSYRSYIQAQVDQFKEHQCSGIDYFETEIREIPLQWLPTCIQPHLLWSVYKGDVVMQKRMVESSFQAAKSDLAMLGIKPGLSFQQFRSYVSIVLGEISIIKNIDASSRDGLTDDDAIKIINDTINDSDSPYSATDLWEVFQEWLIFFFPNRYKRQASSEIFTIDRTIA